MSNIEFRWNDGGRSFWIEINDLWEERLEIVSDCAVRALACALDQNDRYGELWEELTIQKRMNSSSPTTTADSGVNPAIITQVYRRYGLQKIYTATETEHVCLQDVEDMLPAHSTYAVANDEHIVTIRNGVLQDTKDSRDLMGRITAIWLKEE